jgi:hypothetical protein
MTYLKDLIDALRAELQQYGEMLARFEDEETLTAKSTAEEFMAKAVAIQDQEAVIGLVLRRREEAQRHLTPSLLLPEGASLTDIISALPPHYQSLMRALADENAALIARVQRRANQRREWPSRTANPMGNRSRCLSESIRREEADIRDLPRRVAARTPHPGVAVEVSSA